jgi:hypothetical protein
VALNREDTVKDQSDISENESVLYRVEVAGALAASWPEWFAADAVRTAGKNTILDLRVADQAELLGRLRRVHDLNLRLISVTRVEHQAETKNEPVSDK